MMSTTFLKKTPLKVNPYGLKSKSKVCINDANILKNQFQIKNWDIVHICRQLVGMLSYNNTNTFKNVFQYASQI